MKAVVLNDVEVKERNGRWMVTARFSDGFHFGAIGATEAAALEALAELLEEEDRLEPVRAEDDIWAEADS